MRASRRHSLSYASFVLLLAADAVAALALLVDQWVMPGGLWSWLLAAVLAIPLLPVLLKLADRLFELARGAGNIPNPGGTFPWAG